MLKIQRVVDCALCWFNFYPGSAACQHVLSMPKFAISLKKVNSITWKGFGFSSPCCHAVSLSNSEKGKSVAKMEWKEATRNKPTNQTNLEQS